MSKPIPTAERVRGLLDYDQITGVLRWRCNVANVKAGSVAGCAKRTYVAVSIDDVVYRAHQVIWLWMTGEWPKSFIDHKDTKKQNNAWDNLREATKSQNMANKGTTKKSSSGLKGAYQYKAGKKYGKPWQAGITVNRHRIHLGHFATAEEAHAIYCAAAKEHFGEFARAA